MKCVFRILRIKYALDTDTWLCLYTALLLTSAWNGLSAPPPGSVIILSQIFIQGDFLEPPMRGRSYVTSFLSTCRQSTSTGHLCAFPSLHPCLLQRKAQFNLFSLYAPCLLNIRRSVRPGGGCLNEYMKSVFLGHLTDERIRVLSNGQEKERTKPGAALPTDHANQAQPCLYSYFPPICVTMFLQPRARLTVKLLKLVS